MIGMNQIKKKLYTGIAIGGGIGIIGIGLTLWWSLSNIKTYENGTNANFNRDYTKQVVVLNKDIVQGQMISADMLSMVRVHNNTVPTGAILSTSQVSGQVAKFNIPARVPITENMLAAQILSADVREQEINTILMPSDLQEGNFVDIRIMFPNGTDYIVLAEKQVEKISGQTMWMKLSEYERLILNSSVVDSFLNGGTKLYCTKYADPEAQVKAEASKQDTIKGYLSDIIKKEIPNISEASKNPDAVTVDKVFELIVKYNNFAATLTKTVPNYQPNTQVMNVMKSNTNILKEATEKLSSESRTNIESGLKQYEDQNPDKYSNTVSGAQTAITNQQNERNKLLGTTAQ